MPRITIPGAAAFATAALFTAISMSGALAQQTRYATGASPSPTSMKQSIPAAPIFRDFLPQAVDLSKYFPPVGDQGNEGSCVGWATAYAARAYYALQVEHLDNSLPQNIPSPGWIFNIIHLGPDCNGGAYIPDALKALQSGSLSLAEFPYDDTKCPTPLPPARMKAKEFKIDSYEQVWDKAQSPNLDQVKGALAQGHPVVIIASLDASFFNLSAKRSVWHSDASKKDEGGHAFTLVGYDDAAGVFKFINSWTTQWGDNGYGRMDYDTFKARVYEGYIMKLPGDPQVVLADADFSTDPVVEDTPAAPVFTPPLNLRPTDASRDIAALDTPIDVGALQCGRVDIGTDADGNSIATGFVGTQADLDKVDEALKGKVDDNQVTLAPWPACEVRLTLASQLADSDTPQALIDPEAPKVGDRVSIGIESPGFASYLYAAYFAADGTVLNLTQPTSMDLRAKAAHTQVKFGDAESGQMALTVSPPVGDEMLLVVASEKPLFDAARPDSETDRQFLSGLRAATLSGDAGRVTATLLPVTTSE